MTTFITFRDLINKQLDSMFETHGTRLFRTSTSRDTLWNTYLDSFPEGSNETYKTNTEHDCNCCKSFIKNYGNIVAIDKNYNTISIWDIAIEGPYSVVASKMSATIKNDTICGLLTYSERKFGKKESLVMEDMSGIVTQWDHFYYDVPDKFGLSKNGKIANEYKANANSFKRSLEDIKLESAYKLVDLIDSGLVYRGAENKNYVNNFINFSNQYNNIKESKRANFLWKETGGKVSIRTTAVGTILTDLSSGMLEDEALKRFESVMAPSNYKRPKGVFTANQLAKAKETITELGYGDSLERRFATKDDITVNNVLFVDRSKKSTDVFSMLDEKLPENLNKISHIATDIDIETFIDTVIPEASTMSALVENRHRTSFVSLLAPVNKDSKVMLKWDNNFSHVYTGGTTDSELKRAVQSKGGRVDGIIRFSLSWNHTYKNQSLMDLHAYDPRTPNCTDLNRHGCPVKYRIGWDHRVNRVIGAEQDVDNTKEPLNTIPVENITFNREDGLVDGDYNFYIHNWRMRTPNLTGFHAELEFGGNLYQYEYTKPLANKEWVHVATVTKKGYEYSIEHKIPAFNGTSKEWGINTNTFVPINMHMLSPNYWDDNKTGNKHYIFSLEGCVRQEPTRTIFNEYIKDELIKDHKQVFEAIGTQLKAPHSDNQISGIGFSSTKRDSLFVKVDNKRVYKINF